MRVTDLFPSRYLRAAELGTRRPVVTIRRASQETIGPDRRLVIAFDEGSKLFACNKTNALAIARIVGSDNTDDWPGRQIRLGAVEVDFKGQPTLGIRVFAVDEAPRRAADAGLEPAASPRDPFSQGGDDDIPF